MNVRGRILVILTVGLLLGGLSPVRADTLPFTSLEFPPYNYEKNGAVRGFTTDVVKRIVRTMGHEPTVDLLPWQRAQAEAARGEYAGIFTFTKSVKRMEKFHYTAPVARIKDVFFKRRSDTITWRTLSDLSDYEIGASAYNYADVFLDAMEDDTLNVQVVHAETPEILHLRKLKHRRIDLAICELRLCQFLIDKNTPMFRKIDYLERPVGPVRTFHIGISRAWPNSRKLTREFNRHLARMASNGTLQSLQKKYFSLGRIDQPPGDFLRELGSDLRIHAEAHSFAEPGKNLAKAVTNRLEETVSGHVSTLGWDRGTTFVVWTRNGHFRIEREGSTVDLLSSSMPSSEQEGIPRTEGPFRLGILTGRRVSTVKGSVLEFQPVNGETSVGGYLVFNDSGVIHQESSGPVEGEIRLQLFDGRN